ncbi:hypothetical protein AAIH60_34085 [Pseudomonas aeruginosa]|uniref:hypothetical protein n=3 Tax=Pseudomonas aeruginosa TaxID=287 RepID=UPI0031B7760D
MAATERARKTYKTIDINKWANSHGVVYGTVKGSSELETLANAGYTLGIATCAFLGIFVVVYGGIKYVRSVNTQNPMPKYLIFGLIFSALFLNIIGSLSLVSNIDCSDRMTSLEFNKCVSWDDSNSGLTGELKAKIEKTAENKNGWDEFYKKAKPIINIIQMLAFILFCIYLFKLWQISIENNQRNDGAGVTVLKLIACALIVDIPHTVDFVANTIEIFINGVK